MTNGVVLIGRPELRLLGIDPERLLLERMAVDDNRLDAANDISDDTSPLPFPPFAKRVHVEQFSTEQPDDCENPGDDYIIDIGSDDDAELQHAINLMCDDAVDHGLPQQERIHLHSLVSKRYVAVETGERPSC